MKPSSEPVRRAHRLITWLQEHAHQVVAAIVITGLGAVALTGSANHIVHVGAYAEVGVTDEMVWTVAGSLEVLAAFATWEMRSRSGWDRLVPSVVAFACITFIILANLAAADERSWAGQLPWAQAFMVTPPVSFLSVVLIAETSSWRNTRRSGRRAGSKARMPGQQDGRVTADETGESSSGTRVTRRTRTGTRPLSSSDVPGALAGREPNQRTGPDPAPGLTQAGDDPSSVTPVSGSGSSGGFIRGGSDEPSDEPTLNPRQGEDRTAAVARWLREGYRPTDVIQAGMHQFGASKSTIKRDIRAAKATTDPS